MRFDLSKFILETTGATSFTKQQTIQTLWSGYGTIERYQLTGAEYPSVIVKHIQPDEAGHHPRGWNTGLSHQRKLKSYQVETAWYRQWALECPVESRVPLCLGVHQSGNEILLILEDLDASGYPVRKQAVSLHDMKACLRWLAFFHAKFMRQAPTNLWAKGTYWHLDTRPEEWERLDDSQLKKYAVEIDALLTNASFQTFVHGDAKLANFCFSDIHIQVAAVDFQYVGAGCGMKDIAYFIGSCLYEDDCERYEQRLLGVYFEALTEAIAKYQPSIDAKAVEAEWRMLFPVAWTDFHRFLKGWSPGHWKINDYSERIARTVIKNLATA